MSLQNGQPRYMFMHNVCNTRCPTLSVSHLSRFFHAGRVSLNSQMLQQNALGFSAFVFAKERSECSPKPASGISASGTSCSPRCRSSPNIREC